MSVLSIAILSIVVAVLSIQFKNIRAEYSLYLAIAGGLLIAFYALLRLKSVLEVIHQIESYIKINQVYTVILLKIVGITYIAEFASGICKDAGYSSMANQIEIFSKLTILGISMPIIVALLETLNHFFV
ncbi:stage III sporulation protein AD [Clostridia bacterium]|nr:stage III sporulation protein AD [Clostridia bacterium]